MVVEAYLLHSFSFLVKRCTPPSMEMRQTRQDCQEIVSHTRYPFRWRWSLWCRLLPKARGAGLFEALFLLSLSFLVEVKRFSSSTTQGT